MKRVVRLDKNAGSQSLCKLCNDEGIVECKLLPLAVRDGSDENVLKYIIDKGNLLLTFDRTFFIDAGPRLSDSNPGLLLIRPDDGSVRQINAKTAPKLLHDFKQAFARWDIVPWANAMIELTPAMIFIYDTRRTPITSPVNSIIERTRDGWQDDVVMALITIARSSGWPGLPWNDYVI